MADYISREALLRDIEKYHVDSSGKFRHWVEIQHAADVEPVRHGRWVPSKLRNEIERCSKCGKVFRYPSFYGYKFCLNCGAKMDLEGEE